MGNKKKKPRFPLKLKAIVLLAALSVAITAVGAAMSYFVVSRMNTESFKNEALDVANTAALSINGDELKVVKDSILDILHSIPEEEVVLSDAWGSPEFEAQLEKFSPVTRLPEYSNVLSQIKKIQHMGISALSSVYFIALDAENSISYAVYLADAADEDACLPGVIDHEEDANWEAIDDPAAGISPYITHTDTYGWLVTAGAPVYDSKGDFAGFLYIDLSMDDIKARENSFMMMLIIALAVIAIVICFIFVRLTGIAVVDPVNSISKAALSYVKDNKSGVVFESMKINQNDEIGDLYSAVHQMERDLNEHMANVLIMTAEKERLETELNVATKIQADMLPTAFPKNEGYSLFASMTPAKEVGGDFYDFFKIDDDRIGLVIADVSGKGVPAALFMVITKTMLQFRAQSGGTPADVLEDVNKKLCANNESSLFVTVWLGILSISTGKLIMANAGHEYPAIKGAEGDFRLHGSDHCPPLALDPDIIFMNEELTLAPGDCLFLYTDGVTEAKDSNGQRFKEKRLISTLNKNSDASPEELITTVKKELESFSNGTEQFDDITMLSVRL